MKWWWLKLARYVYPEWRVLIAIALLILSTVAVKLLAPWPLKLVIDNVLTRTELPLQLNWIYLLPGTGSPQGLVGWLALATVVLFLAKRLLTVSQSYLESGAGSRMTFALASDLFQHVQRQSIAFHRSHHVGDLVARIAADSSCVRTLIIETYLPVTTSLLTLVFTFGVMWQLNPGIAAVALCLTIPMAIVTKYFAGFMAQRGYEQKTQQGHVMALAEQSLTAMPMIQAFGREEDEDRRFRNLAHRSVHANLRALLSQEQFKVATNFLTMIGTVIVMVTGGVAVLRREMSLGDLVVLLAYFAALYAPIETLAYLGTGFASASASARRIFEILQVHDDSIVECMHPQTLDRRGTERGCSIRIEHVTFGYEARQPVLFDANLDIQAGEKIAIVGRTGAGKSTLISLVARLFDPWQGNVWLDHFNVRDLSLRSLRESFAMVLQEPYLFPLTIAENISYGRPTASREEIVAAAQAARADEFIRRFPQGYDTLIGERGATLSGGEKQRISIARAILKDAPVMILDEPTSALDAETEWKLLEALEHLMRNRTVLIVAHRLSTVRAADRIILVENGQLVEIGFAELETITDVYQDLKNVSPRRPLETSGEVESLIV